MGRASLGGHSSVSVRSEASHARCALFWSKTKRKSKTCPYLQVMRAELMGDAESVIDLKNELDELRARMERQKSGKSKPISSGSANAAGESKQTESRPNQRSKTEPSAKDRDSEMDSDGNLSSGENDDNAEEILFSAPDRHGNVRLMADLPARGAEDQRAAKRKVRGSLARRGREKGGGGFQGRP